MNESEIARVIKEVYKFVISLSIKYFCCIFLPLARYESHVIINPIMPVKKTVTKKTTSVKKSSAKKSVAAKKAAPVLQKTLPVQSQTTPVGTMSYVKNPRLWVGVAVVVVAVLLYTYKGLFVAAMVNGQPVSRLSVISQLEKQGGKQALSNVITEDLVMQEAQKRHITVSQSDIDGQIKKIEDSLKGQGVTLDDALAARGLTRQDLVDQIKLQGLLDKMVGTNVKVTDDDVQAYIDKNQDSLPKDLSDDDLKKQVRQQLEQQQLQDKTQAFLSDLQKKASIQYFVSY